ncbi:hypothetical protein PFISCL1PPCAC_16829, partial [Pristionchus fissidentatus]
PNIIVVKCGYGDSISNEDSPLVYFCSMLGHSLLVLDTTTMETLTIELPSPVSNSTTHYQYYFVGVHGEVITVERVIETKVGDELEYTAEICNSTFPEALKNFNEAAVERDLIRHAEEKRIAEVALANSKLSQSKEIEHVPVDPKPDFISRFAEEFKPIKELGRGAFGCVFEAENLLDEWKYAVKRIAIPQKSNEDSVHKMLREVRAMARFDHPNIVRYYGSWIEKPPKIPHHDQNVYLYIQMQLCIYSLEDFLRDKLQKPRDHHRMRIIFTQLMEAVAYIHGKGVIHRDLKPSNILFDEDDKIRVCDLG